MKLLVFAHTPPPHHGQSYMVKLLLDRLGGDVRGKKKLEGANLENGIECYHVNCRYSDDLEDIGSFRAEKVWLVFRYCIEAIWCRFRYGVSAFYYVPAPGKRAALYRDWIVMLFCRPFFRDFIHHWHAAGMGDWLQNECTWFERWITHWLLGKPTLGIALGIPTMRDPLWLRSAHVAIVPNAVPDPCPDFDENLLPRRRARIAARRELLAGRGGAGDEQAGIARILFLAHCSESKGLFVTLEAVSRAIAISHQNGDGLGLRLTVAGAFIEADEEERFRRRIAEPDLAGKVEYAGFVSGDAKERLLCESDLFCFPTFYEAEGQPVNLIEAMAHGLTPVTTRWRTIPDLLPMDYSGLVMPQDVEDTAHMLLRQLTCDHAEELRAHFLSQYTDSQHVAFLRHALGELDALPATVAG